jgi:hypothetical protein
MFFKTPASSGPTRGKLATGKEDPDQTTAISIHLKIKNRNAIIGRKTEADAKAATATTKLHGQRRMGNGGMIIFLARKGKN